MKRRILRLLIYLEIHRMHKKITVRMLQILFFEFALAGDSVSSNIDGILLIIFMNYRLIKRDH